MIGKYFIYKEILTVVLLFVGSFLLFGTLLSIPIWLLWNWLMPNIFGLVTINIFEAFGLSILTKFLFATEFKVPEKKKMKTDNYGYDVNKKVDELMKDIKTTFDN